ncbi:MAG: hypothetical protein ACXACY_30030 [Candidatus Hodarchaeales archaeon]|jgi:hypothetical protein
MPKEIMHTFKVIPQGMMFSFPIDMLRYDFCCPAHENDSAMIGFTFERGLKAKNVEAIELKRIAQKQWVPTQDCWKSFGWKVVEHNGLEVS